MAENTEIEDRGPIPVMTGPNLVREQKRTHMCGDLRAAHVGDEVILMGWVHSYRDLGGAVFIDLRDRTGLAQVVFDQSVDETCHKIGDRLRSEWVVGIVGKVRSRGENVNPNLPTGEIEVLASYIQVFNQSQTPPFVIATSTSSSSDPTA